MSQQDFETGSKGDNYRRKRLIRVVPLLAAIAGSGWSYFAQRGVLPVPFERACPIVSPLELKSVNQMLVKPPAQQLGSIILKYNHYPRSEKSILKENDAIRQFIDEQAAKDGFTLVDDLAYQHQLNRAESPTEILEILNEFTKHYGFKVSIGSDYYSRILGAYKHGSNKDSLGKIINGASSLMEIFHYLPLEIAKYSDIKEIEVVDTLPVDVKGDARPDGKIRIDPTSFMMGDFSLYMHELGHLVDFKECGDEALYHKSDNQFLELNPRSFHYTNNWGSRTYDSWLNVTVTPYGAKSVLEDKAELYKNMLNGLEPADFNSSYRVVREKYRLLLARLDVEIPGIAKYLTSISVRTVSEETPIDTYYELASPQEQKDFTVTMG